MITRRDVLKAMAATGLTVPIAQAYEIEIPQHGVIAIHSRTALRKDDVLALKAALVERTGRDITVLSMPLDMAIESLPEKEMNAAGWYRR